MRYRSYYLYHILKYNLRRVLIRIQIKGLELEIVIHDVYTLIFYLQCAVWINMYINFYMVRIQYLYMRDPLE